MAKRILSIMLIAVCVVMCTACGKLDEPNIEPSVTVSEMLETLENAGYTIKANEETKVESDYIVNNLECNIDFGTNDKYCINSMFFDCKQFNSEQKDLLKVIWTKLTNDKILVGEMVYDMLLEENLQNGVYSNLTQGNISFSYLDMTRINEDDGEYHITFSVN